MNKLALTSQQKGKKGKKDQGMKDQHQRQILISLNVNEPLGCWAAFCCSLMQYQFMEVNSGRNSGKTQVKTQVETQVKTKVETQVKLR